MLVTQEEFQAILEGSLIKLNEVLERVAALSAENALRALPATLDNLMIQGMAMKKTADKFYEDNPDFTKHKSLVAGIIEELDAKNPGQEYYLTLQEAVPIIKERISKMKGLNTTTDKRPSVQELNTKFNGEI